MQVGDLNQTVPCPHASTFTLALSPNHNQNPEINSFPFYLVFSDLSHILLLCVESAVSMLKSLDVDPSFHCKVFMTTSSFLVLLHFISSCQSSLNRVSSANPWERGNIFYFLIVGCQCHIVWGTYGIRSIVAVIFVKQNLLHHFYSAGFPDIEKKEACYPLTVRNLWMCICMKGKNA